MLNSTVLFTYCTVLQLCLFTCCNVLYCIYLPVVMYFTVFIYLLYWTAVVMRLGTGLSSPAAPVLLDSLVQFQSFVCFSVYIQTKEYREVLGSLLSLHSLDQHPLPAQWRTCPRRYCRSWRWGRWPGPRRRLERRIRRSDRFLKQYISTYFK